MSDGLHYIAMRAITITGKAYAKGDFIDDGLPEGVLRRSMGNGRLALAARGATAEKVVPPNRAAAEAVAPIKGPDDAQEGSDALSIWKAGHAEFGGGLNLYNYVAKSAAKAGIEVKGGTQALLDALHEAGVVPSAIEAKE